MRNTILLLITLFFSLLLGCNKSEPLPPSPSPAYDQSVKSGQSDTNYEYYFRKNATNDSYHTDPNYKYEYRIGSSGDYEYNYDVSGSDQEGNSFSGNIDMDGKYGSGTIEDEDGNTFDVDLEWIGKGELEATDPDGKSYDLSVD